MADNDGPGQAYVDTGTRLEEGCYALLHTLGFRDFFMFFPIVSLCESCCHGNQCSDT